VKKVRFSKNLEKTTKPVEKLIKLETVKKSETSPCPVPCPVPANLECSSNLVISSEKESAHNNEHVELDLSNDNPSSQQEGAITLSLTE
jgi:hypothetical protein